MNVKIISKTDDEIEVQIEGEDHTLLNVLKGALLRVEEVDAATYDLNPDQSGRKTEPILYVKSEEGDPLETIDEATQSLQENAAEFEDSFESATG